MSRFAPNVLPNCSMGHIISFLTFEQMKVTTLEQFCLLAYTVEEDMSELVAFNIPTIEEFSNYF